MTIRVDLGAGPSLQWRSLKCPQIHWSEEHTCPIALCTSAQSHLLHTCQQQMSENTLILTACSLLGNQASHPSRTWFSCISCRKGCEPSASLCCGQGTMSHILGGEVVRNWCALVDAQTLRLGCPSCGSDTPHSPPLPVLTS